MDRKNNDQKIIFCNCAFSDVIPEDKKRDIEALLKEITADMTIVPDLCGLAATQVSVLKDLTSPESLIFVACYPRAIRSLLAYANIPLENKRVTYYNLKNQPLEEIKTGLTNGFSEPTDVSISSVEKISDWIPWFPVIDYDRCKNCKQCASFCLFQVYQIEEDGKVTVKNPQNCKTNCPACARICPEAAIIFPKLNESPINGNEITDEKIVRAKIKLNVEEMLGDDIYEALAQRRKKAKQILLRKEAIRKAQQERASCMENLKQNKEPGNEIPRQHF